MKYIEEIIETRAPAHTVFKAWSENYLKRGYVKGKPGYIVDGKRRIKFEVLDVKKNESLTIVWHSLIAKLVFIHTVEQQKKGSTVSTKVQIKGIFAPLVRLIIRNKIRNYLKTSLSKFKSDLEMY